jgi:phosphoribosylaminoimidazole-succinocarboxamide synthase
MELLFKGKTKDVYNWNDGMYLLKFKDDATGKDGVFDPGENQVGLTIEGLGSDSLKLTDYFFRKINAMGIPTQFVSSDLSKAEMVVKPAKLFGDGVEFVCRFRATGSFMRRYGAYAAEGQTLDALVEITLKDDARKDPPITEDTLVQLGIMTANDIKTAISHTKTVSCAVKDDLKEKGLDLYDIKLEFGLIDGKVALIDEISAGSVRVYKDGLLVEPLMLSKLVFG